VSCASVLNTGDIQKAAREIKKLYEARRRVLYPSYVMRRSGKRWTTIWPKAAEKCLSLSVSPQQLVEAAFDCFRPYPHPNQLLSSSVEDHVVRGLQTQSERHGSLLFRLEMDELRTCVSMGDAIEHVLMSGSCELSPLFRYVIARCANLDFVCDKYEEAARRQMQYCASSYLASLPRKGLPE